MAPRHKVGSVEVSPIKEKIDVVQERFQIQLKNNNLLQDYKLDVALHLNLKLCQYFDR